MTPEEEIIYNKRLIKHFKETSDRSKPMGVHEQEAWHWLDEIAKGVTPKEEIMYEQIVAQLIPFIDAERKK